MQSLKNLIPTPGRGLTTFQNERLLQSGACAGCRDAPPLVQGPPGETSGFALIHVGTLLFHGDRDGLAHSGLGCFERRGSGGGC